MTSSAENASTGQQLSLTELTSPDTGWSALQAEAPPEHWITRDEFRLVIDCLQAGSASADQRASYDKALEIFKRLLDNLEREGRVLHGRRAVSRY
jgi:hypothetical protein